MSKIDLTNIPKHIAIIMDGNGRWAKKKGSLRVFGHKSGVKAVKTVTEAATEIGVKYLTLYAFSTENWNRPDLEVNALMQLLVSTIKKETQTLIKNNIKLDAIGNINSLPKACQRELKSAMDATKDNTGMTLILALSYSGRWEMLNAFKSLMKEAKEQDLDIESIEAKDIEKYLMTNKFPDPELLIRTSGEMRISNFLLWQIAYSELYFTDVLWPDFGIDNLYDAIQAFQQRERRFGKTSEQLNKVS
ncbi:MAG: isoprenyl transferase [Flammeovirgaceae bacterium]|nr:isoprenyl transferase [Flammeovirgaceae bacterium]